VIELAPYFCLARALWIPRVITWEQGFFEQMDSPEGFKDYYMTLEASRFLARSVRREDCR